MIYYLIRHKNTGLFLKGTPEDHKYYKDGRVFQTLGKLRSFLTIVMKSDQFYNKRDNGNRNRLADWEIVELETVIKEVKGVHEVIKPDKLIELL